MSVCMCACDVRVSSVTTISTTRLILTVLQVVTTNGPRKAGIPALRHII